MACQKSYGVSTTQVSKPPAYFDAVKGEWVISYASWDGARITDPKAERPTITGLRNGLYILDYVRAEGDRTSTVDEVCLFVYNSPAPVDPTAKRFSPGKEYSMPQPVREWPPRKQGEICHVLGVPPVPAPTGPIYDAFLQYADEQPIPQLGVYSPAFVIDLIDRNNPTVPLTNAPPQGAEIRVYLAPEYEFEYASPTLQLKVITFAPNEGGPQGNQTPNRMPLSAGPGVTTYEVWVGGVMTSTGQWTYPVPGSGAQ